MPVYEFHIQDGAGRLDRSKRTLSSALEARCEATHTIGAMIIDTGRTGDTISKISVTVRDQQNEIVFGLHVRAFESNTA